MSSPDLFFTSPLASKPCQRETGTGFLTALNGGQVGCRFILEQVPAGDIALRCLVDTVQNDAWQERPRSKDLFREDDSLSLDLVTQGGCRLENFRFHPSNGGIAINGRRQSYEFELSGVDLRLAQKRHFDRPVAFAEFSIVNLNVDGGNACVRLSNLWHWDDGVVVLRLGERECWLRGVTNSYDIVKHLEASKGIDVTAKIMLRLHSLDEWNDIEEHIDNLCTVLTLLTGNRVTWISARAVDSLGYTLWARWRDSVTNPYTTRDMLNTLSDEQGRLRITTLSCVPIIERMFLHFSEAKQKWNIRAAINTWHETVISAHFLEQQGLLIAACVEMLRTRYLKHKGRQTVLDAQTFEAALDDIRASVETILSEKFPADAEWSNKRKKSHQGKLHGMSSHVRGLNYPAFAGSLQNMAFELGMKSFTRDDEAISIRNRFSMPPVGTAQPDPSLLGNSIKCFVHIRNNLTHQGVFLLTTDDDSEASRNERMRQLKFMQRFAAAFLCSALGWTQPLPTALDFLKEGEQRVGL